MSLWGRSGVGHLSAGSGPLPQRNNSMLRLSLSRPSGRSRSVYVRREPAAAQAVGPGRPASGRPAGGRGAGGPDQLRRRPLPGGDQQRCPPRPARVRCRSSTTTPTTANLNCTRSPRSRRSGFRPAPRASTSVDLQSNAFGMPWGHARTWTGYNEASQNGNGWAVSGLPYLTLDRNEYDGHAAIVRVNDGAATYDFDGLGMQATAFAARDGQNAHLSYVAPTTDGSGNKLPGEFRLTDAGGNVTTFYELPRVTYDGGYGDYARLFAGAGLVQEATTQWTDPTTKAVLTGPSSGTAAAYRFGGFKGYVSASSRLAVTTEHDAAGNLTGVVRTDGSGQYERFRYVYSNWSNTLGTLGGSADLVQSVSLQKGTSASGPWTTVRAAAYDYYTGQDAGDAAKYGRLGEPQNRRHQRLPAGPGQRRRGRPEVLPVHEVVQHGRRRVRHGHGLRPPRPDQRPGHHRRGRHRLLQSVGRQHGHVRAAGRRSRGRRSPGLPPTAALSPPSRTTPTPTSTRTPTTSSPMPGTPREPGTASGTTPTASSGRRPPPRAARPAPAGSAPTSTSTPGATRPGSSTTPSGPATAPSTPGSRGSPSTCRTPPSATGPTTTSGSSTSTTAGPRCWRWCSTSTAPAPPPTTPAPPPSRGTTTTAGSSSSPTPTRSRTSTATTPAATWTWSTGPPTPTGSCPAAKGWSSTTSTATPTPPPPSPPRPRPARSTGCSRPSTSAAGTTAPTSRWPGTEYFEHPDGATGATVHPLAVQTAYWDVDGDGDDDPVDTTYAYAWRADAATGLVETNQVLSQTVTMPTVTAAHNGPGSATAVTTTYDAVGRPVWTRDADGFLTLHGLRPVHGGRGQANQRRRHRPDDDVREPAERLVRPRPAAGCT